MLRRTSISWHKQLPSSKHIMKALYNMLLTRPNSGMDDGHSNNTRGDTVTSDMSVATNEVITDSEDSAEHPEYDNSTTQG